MPSFCGLQLRGREKERKKERKKEKVGLEYKINKEQKSVKQ
jgi:hypothetical protein